MTARTFFDVSKIRQKYEENAVFAFRWYAKLLFRFIAFYVSLFLLLHPKREIPTPASSQKKALKNSRVLRQHSGGALPLYNERQNLFAGDGKTSFGPFHHNSFSSSYGGGRGGNNPIMLHICVYVCSVAFP